MIVTDHAPGTDAARTFRETRRQRRGVGESGARLIATGDVTDDDLLPRMGAAAEGVVTTHHHSGCWRSAGRSS